jgi:uncharacterized protein YcbX
MHLQELWRYPVKSMAGEMLAETTLGALGVPGDRALYVVGDRGVIDARSRPKLLELQASTDIHGEPTVEGRRWDDPDVARAVIAAVGAPAKLTRARGEERFDILPLLVATDGAIEAMHVDRRRFRPNLLIGGVEGLAERAWEGRYLRIGEAVVGLHSLRQRCVITTWDPDTHLQDREVLRRIHREFEGTLALNAWTAVPGRVAVGDPVELIDGDYPAPTLFGRLA